MQNYRSMLLVATKKLSEYSNVLFCSLLTTLGFAAIQTKEKRIMVFSHQTRSKFFLLLDDNVKTWIHMIHTSWIFSKKILQSVMWGILRNKHRILFWSGLYCFLLRQRAEDQTSTVGCLCAVMSTADWRGNALNIMNEQRAEKKKSFGLTNSILANKHSCEERE